MRRIMVSGVVAAGMSVGLAGMAGAATHHGCKSPGTAYGNIRATNTDCGTALKVVRADTKGKRYPGWKCTAKPYPGGASVTCLHKGGRKVTFQVAD